MESTHRLAALAPSPVPSRRRGGECPTERRSLTHKFCIDGHEGYLTAGLYDDGTVGELFISDFGKEGSTLRGVFSAWATTLSIALQHGVPLESLVRKFAWMRFEPQGLTENPEIPHAHSIPDYVARWLTARFLDTDAQDELGVLTAEVKRRRAAALDAGTQPAGARARRARPGPAVHAVRRRVHGPHRRVRDLLDVRSQHRLRLARPALTRAGQRVPPVPPTVAAEAASGVAASAHSASHTIQIGAIRCPRTSSSSPRWPASSCPSWERRPTGSCVRSTGSTSGSTASRRRSSRSTASASRDWKRASRRNRRTPRARRRR